MTIETSNLNAGEDVIPDFPPPLSPMLSDACTPCCLNGRDAQRSDRLRERCPSPRAEQDCELRAKMCKTE